MFHLKETVPGQRQIIKSETIDLMAQNKFITGTEGGIQAQIGFTLSDGLDVKRANTVITIWHIPATLPVSRRC
jgi:hypothetical protein